MMQQKQSAPGWLRFYSAVGVVLLTGCASSPPPAWRVTLQADTKENQGRDWTEEERKATRRVLENRLRSLSISPRVTVTPPNKIILDLPSLPDETKTLQQLTTTDSMRFYLLRQLGNDTTGRRGTLSLARDPKGNGESLVDSLTGKPLTSQELDALIFRNKNLKPVVTSAQLLPKSQAQIQPNGNVVLAFEFDKQSSQDFEDVTRANKGEHLAIFLDKRLLVAPTINGPIVGPGIIEGNFTVDQAKTLSDHLNAGTLPVPIEVVKTERYNEKSP